MTIFHPALYLCHWIIDKQQIWLDGVKEKKEQRGGDTSTNHDTLPSPASQFKSMRFNGVRTKTTQALLLVVNAPKSRGTAADCADTIESYHICQASPGRRLVAGDRSPFLRHFQWKGIKSENGQPYRGFGYLWHVYVCFNEMDFTAFYSEYILQWIWDNYAEFISVMNRMTNIITEIISLLPPIGNNCRSKG